MSLNKGTAFYYGTVAAAAFLTRCGYRTAPTTLDCKVSRGGGPLFRKYGRYRMYEEADLLAWAESQCTKKRTSSSDLPR